MGKRKKNERKGKRKGEREEKSIGGEVERNEGEEEQQEGEEVGGKGMLRASAFHAGYFWHRESTPIARLSVHCGSV